MMVQHKNTITGLPLSGLIAAQFVFPFLLPIDVCARDYFNPALLELSQRGQENVDLSSFEHQGGQLPGTYRVDIFLNNEKMDTRNVEFRQAQDVQGNRTLMPCLTVDELTAWGVQTSRFPGLRTTDNSCADMSAIPQATSELRFDTQQLLLSFPQSSLNNTARGWVDPAQWDDGIPAFLLNYSASGARNYARQNGSYNSDSQYLNLRPGINVGPWRLRNYTTWSRSSTRGSDGSTQSNWDTVYTYLQRDIRSLRSRLTMGDSTSSSGVYDGIPFRGVQLASDDDMLPESLRGYAPVVRGIARTNAEVTIRQNGYVIYQTYVSPGSFEITDMYPTGGSGDLHLTIKEADGSVQESVIPYASLPVLQREGQMKYSLTSAVYRSYDNSVKKTPFTEATGSYGLSHGITLYGGGQFSSKYQSLAAGLGKNLGSLGAISVDMTQSWATEKDQPKTDGQSWRLRYSKNIVETGTNFAIAGYRYATDGYRDMQEVLETYRDTSGWTKNERRRNRAELTMNQSLWRDAGSLALTAIREDYWTTERRMESYGVNYSNSWKGISYSLAYTHNRNSMVTRNYGSGRRQYDTDNLVSLTVSVPLSIFGPGTQTAYASYMMNSSQKGNTSHSLSLSGTALEQDNLSWGVQEGYGTKGQGNSGSLTADWRATYGQVNGGYSYDKYNQRLNYGLQGSLIAHENGITLGQPLGETVALVAAPGADGVDVNSGTGVRTDFRGYAVVPYMSPYRKNDISLNSETFGDETEVETTTQTVVPTRGAVVRASYITSTGSRAIMALTRHNGKPVPFGATVTRAGNSSARGFMVGDRGEVYLTGLADGDRYTVQWGTEPDQRCAITVTLPSAKPQGGIHNLAGVCR